MESSTEKPSDLNIKNQLLVELKKQVKCIMEEAVAKKYVPDNGSSVRMLCLAIEACLVHRLKKRMIGPFWLSANDALIYKLAKKVEVANEVASMLPSTPTFFQSVTTPTLSAVSFFDDKPSQPSMTGWIHIALVTKRLYEIICYLVNNSEEFYECGALLRDVTDSELFISLLAGPCVLEFSKAYHGLYEGALSDPNANELLLRHRLKSPTHFDVQRLLWSRRTHFQISSYCCRLYQEYNSFRDTIESFHQNSQSKLLYGKNNVRLQQRESLHFLSGYLSLHDTCGKLYIRWTPNGAMSSMGSSDSDESYLDYAISICINRIANIYCFQYLVNEDMVVFVSRDGIKYPTLHFPKGGHVINFVSCIECGLYPHGYLDPPLSHYNDVGEKSLVNFPTDSPFSQNFVSHAADFIFAVRCNSPSGSSSVEMSNSSTPQDAYAFFGGKSFDKRTCESLSLNHNFRNAMETIYKELRLQILTRVFHGWLEFCRYVKSLRSRTSCIFDGVYCLQKSAGILTRNVWYSCSRTLPQWELICSSIYLHGITDHTLRKQIWPFLLGHYDFVMDSTQIETVALAVSDEYNSYKKEWSSFTENIDDTFTIAEPNESSADSSQRPCSPSEFFDASDNLPLAVDSHRMEVFIGNIHPIDKDVRRCDRAQAYFKQPHNLQKLRNIMCTYVWVNLDKGYFQGMCDILAPLLVVLEDEALTYRCFSLLMQHLSKNFPDESTHMNKLFEDLQRLLQVNDHDLYDHMFHMDDHAHLYFAYRWFLLDFKREFAYEDVFLVWETIWAANLVVTKQFRLIFALALVEQYRSIILDNEMDFTDVLRFFNEMAEHHDVKKTLSIARDLIEQLRELIL